jgi:hypothetical protein
MMSTSGVTLISETGPPFLPIPPIAIAVLLLDPGPWAGEASAPPVDRAAPKRTSCCYEVFLMK